MDEQTSLPDSRRTEEERVEARSSVFKKELGLRDLIFTQIVFVVGTSWVGTAAKLGPSQTVYWLLAILLFYLPVAAVVIYLNRIMPLEGGLYQWAKFGFNDFAGFMVAWNLWLLGIVVMAGTGLVVRLDPQRRSNRHAYSRDDSRAQSGQVGAQCRRAVIARNLRSAGCASFFRKGSWRASSISPRRVGDADSIAFQPEHFQQDGARCAQRF